MKESEKYLYVESLKEASEKLQNLQTFDPKVFEDATISYDQPPNVTSFILMLAVAHTEIKNLSLLRSWVGSQKPEKLSGRNKELGEYNGLSNYLFRICIGTVVELLKKIQETEVLIQSEEFKKFYRLIPKKHKPAWDSLVKIAMGISVEGEFKIFKDIRDKITFHYDFRNLAKGYKSRFDGVHNDDDRPFVSIGDSQIATRFFFADASSEGYINLQIGKADMESLNCRLDDVLDKVNVALFSLVKSFIQIRSPFREYKKK